MSPVKLTLLGVAAAIAVMVGSFIWFVATWDPSKEDSITDITQTTLRGLA
jgi:hypothetical protein